MAKKKRIEMYYQLPRGLCLEELTDEEAGIIWKAIDRYTGKREKMPTALMRVIYKQCCDHIDAEDERYNDFCERQKERSRMRKMYQDKQSDDNLGYPRITMDNLGHPSNHNQNQKQNQNTESETESESQSKTESQSESTTYGGGNTAATAVERLMSNAQFMNDTSQLVMMPMKMMRDEMQKFALQLRVTNDTTTDEHEIIKGLLAWLRKGKRMNETEQAQKNNGSNERTYTPAEALDIYRRGQGLRT